MPISWYALVVRPHHEKVVHDHLLLRDYDAYLPLYLTRRRWSDRMKLLELPLFPGYVFCRFSFRQRVPLLRIPGVRGLVSIGNNPAPIPDLEISALKKLSASGLPIHPWPTLKIGQRVRVKSGPLRGLHGVLAQIKSGWHIAVNVEILQRSVSAVIDREAVEPL